MLCDLVQNVPTQFTYRSLTSYIPTSSYDTFVNCNWVVTRWEQYSTHLHTNNT